MISRYSRPEMRVIWSEEAKWNFLLAVEVAVAEEQSRRGIIPQAAATAIRRKARVDVQAIAARELVTHHDVLAFVETVAESVGSPHGQFVHYGLTSSDVLDTGLALQLGKAYEVLAQSWQRMIEELNQMVRAHAETLCVGRTHGIHAEPTTFGLKLLGHYMMLDRCWQRLTNAFEECRFGKLSGAVGVYTNLPPEIEEAVCKNLQLRPEPMATQVVPRDRHAHLVSSFSLMGAAIENLALELRHLQRTEVGEVIEGFQPGQKGSSAMPHKKNPISAENLTGCARILRTWNVAAIENVALWHERDISHSSVERVMLPDLFILLDYMLNRLQRLLKGIYVDQQRMLENLNALNGRVYSSRLLVALVQKGVSRDQAYQWIQSLSFNNSQTSLKELVAADPRMKSFLKPNELKSIFDSHDLVKLARQKISQHLGRGADKKTNKVKLESSRKIAKKTLPEEGKSQAKTAKFKGRPM